MTYLYRSPPLYRMKPGERAGITPVVAIVLLLMMTVAASGGAYAWMQQVQNEAQEDADQGLSSRLDVKSVTCEGSVATIAVSNTGSRAFTGGPADVFLYADDTLAANATTDISGESFLQPGGVSILHVSFPTAMENGLQHRIELDMPGADTAVTGTCDARSSLAVYYRFDEGSGIWVNDSGGALDATLKNGSTACADGDCPTWVAGKRGTAVLFDGSNDYAASEYNVSGSDAYSTGVTYMAWISRADTGTGSRTRILSLDASEYWSLDQDSGTSDGDHSPGGYTSTGSGNTRFLDGSVPLPQDTWTHVAMVWDPAGPEMRLYINGSLDGTLSTDPTLGTGSTRFLYLADGSEASGFDSGQNNAYFGGRIDEMQIHHSALSEGTISRIYDATR